MSKATITNTMQPFLNYLYRKDKAGSTALAYKKDIIHFKDFLKNELNNKVRYLDKISKAEIRQYKDYLLEKAQCKEIARSTVNRRFNSLKTYFNFLEEEFEIPNITKGDNFANRGKGLTEAEYLPNYLKLEDIKIVLDVIKKSNSRNKYRDYAIFLTLANTGCRRSELLNIKDSDVDLFNKCIKITRQKNRTADILPIGQDVIDAIVKWMEVKNNRCEYLFTSLYGKRLSETSFTEMFNFYIENSGLQNNVNFKITPHTFRHTFITHSIINNIPEEKIMRFTGHRDKDSLRPYTHLKPNDLSDISNIFRALQ